MSETSGRIMNTAEEEREEHQPEDYYNFSIYLFVCVCVCERVCVCVCKQNRRRVRACQSFVTQLQPPLSRSHFRFDCFIITNNLVKLKLIPPVCVNEHFYLHLNLRELWDT